MKERGEIILVLLFHMHFPRIQPFNGVITVCLVLSSNYLRGICEYSVQAFKYLKSVQ